jgi:lysozyme family protein
MPPGKPNPLFLSKSFIEAGQNMLMHAIRWQRARRNGILETPWAPPGASDAGDAGLNPPPPAAPELPEFRSPAFLIPGMLQITPPENSEGTDPGDLEPARPSDRIFQTIWPHLAAREGRYSNDPADPGGETMHGISRKFVEAHDLKIGNVGAIVDEQAHNIVKQRIYRGRNIDLLPPELQPQVLDASLPAEYAGIATLQRVLNDMGAHGKDGKPLTVDGGIGEKTLYAVDSLPPAAMRELRDRYAGALKDRYTGVATANNALEKFLPGWLDRAEFFRIFELPK